MQPDQTTYETYHLALLRMHKVLRLAVGPLVYPFALVGLAIGSLTRRKPPEWLFLGIILTVSAAALVRLYATAGYGTQRHGLVPGMVLTLAAAHAIVKLSSAITAPGRWLSVKREPLYHWLRPAIASLFVMLAVVVPNLLTLGPRNQGPFSVYHAAAQWLSRRHATPRPRAGLERLGALLQ